MKLSILSILLGISSALWAKSSAKVLFNEDQISQYILKNPPSLQQIEASYLGAQQKASSIRDALTLRLEAEGSLFRSKERPLNGFDGGVTQRATEYSVGLVKPTQYGMNLGVKSFGSKITNPFITDAATSGVGVELSLDLFKDFLGRSTNSNLKKSEFEMKRAELEKKIGIKTFEANLRKLYWNLVAIEEKRKLLKSLVSSAEKQYKESVKRNKSRVADSGEVARYRSQLSSRRSSLLSLTYQRGGIIRTLKELIPELNGRNITIGTYSVPKTIKDVIICSAKIRSFPEAPEQFTPYDEIINYLEQEERYEKKIDDTINSPDIKLVGSYFDIGRDIGFDAARDTLSSDGRARRSIGIQVSIPIGGSKSETEDIKRKLTDNLYQAEMRSRLYKIKSYHTETADIIKILKQVVDNQKETNLYLKKSLKVSQKKYKQARISVQELISEQDSHLQSQLDEIDTNLTVIITLMDYFAVFPDFPCKLNGVKL